jgi:hypothetical protein
MRSTNQLQCTQEVIIALEREHESKSNFRENGKAGNDDD